MLSAINKKLSGIKEIINCSAMDIQNIEYKIMEVYIFEK